MSDPQHVLEQFGIRGASVTTLGDTDNLNHRVSTPDGATFLLRTHRSERHDRANLESEAAWLQHLYAQGVRVQRPVAIASGGFVLELDGMQHSLLTWLEGKVVEALNESQAEATGALMARLHMLASTFTPPPGFVRPHYNAAWLDGTLERLRCVDWLGPDMALLESGVRFAQSAFGSEHGTDILIHADIHAANLVFDGVKVSAIDFDLCGFGPAGFDIATAFGFLERELHAPFLRGYASLSDVPESFEAQRVRFDIASFLENLAFLALREHERQFIEKEMLPALRAELPSILEAQG